MAREVDKRKTARALRKLRRVAEQSQGEAAVLTSWETDFVAGVAERLETYGSAFRDPEKGSLEEPLSSRQTQIVRVLTRKTRARKAASKDEGVAADEAGLTGGAAAGKAGPVRPKGPAERADAPPDPARGRGPKAGSMMRRTPMRRARARDYPTGRKDEA